MVMTLPSRGHFSSPLVSSVGMKGRALFLPDISLTARRYLSVLIRAVAGPLWLLPGCESNHTLSSPLSLIYGGENSLAGLTSFERTMSKANMDLTRADSQLLPYFICLLSSSAVPSEVSRSTKTKIYVYVNTVHKHSQYMTDIFQYVSMPHITVTFMYVTVQSENVATE